MQQSDSKKKKQRKKKDATSETKKDTAKREVNGIEVEQRISDGFINGTAMCVAHNKKINEWLSNQATLTLIEALAEDMEIEKPMCGISRTSTGASLSSVYPDLIAFKMGSPSNGGGVWLHPDLAIQLAQWCNPFFAIQVSRWVQERIVELEKQRRAEQEQQNQWKAIKACVLPAPKRWSKMFPSEFWQKLELVTGRPQNINSWLVRYIYARFPQGVHKAITQQNPRNEVGGRKYKTHQFLTPDVGVSALELFKAQFVAVMDVSPINNYAQFVRNLKKVFSNSLQLELPLLDEIEQDQDIADA